MGSPDGTAAPSSTAGFMTFFPLIAIVATFYFFYIVPQQKKRKLEQEKENQRVVEVSKLKAMPLNNFLKQNGLEQYSELFEKNKIESIAMAVDLTDSDLLNMGISSFGDRKNILNLFAEKQSLLKEPVKAKPEKISLSVYLELILKTGNKLFVSTLIALAIVFVLALCFHVYIGTAGIKVFSKKTCL